MKINSVTTERGSVLVTALITITILTLICATSLYVASQNTSAGIQTASWQQALSGAESAVDQAFNALNTNAWSGSGWRTKSTTLPYPTTKPTGGATASGPPTTSTSYIYLIPSDIIFQSGVEGNSSVSSWVTIDTAGLPKDSNNNQWYRVRATGTAGVPGLKRVSNQRFDNDLRKLSLRVSPVASRTIEVIAQPQDRWAYGIVLRNSIYMNGNTYIDSFNSTNAPWSTRGGRSNANIATVNSYGSNLHNEPIYGNLAYSGPTITGTGGVTGTVSTPFNVLIPDTSDPSWSAPPSPPTSANPNGTLSGAPSGVLYAGSASNLATQSNPTHVKINGNFTLNGGALTIANGNPPGSNGIVPDAYIEIYVSGQFSTTSVLTQNSGVHVKWYVDGNISTGGSSYTNQSGTASYTTFIGVGTGQVSIGGNADFIGVVNAPGYDITITGGGSLFGSAIGNSLYMNGSGNLHYDEALVASESSSFGYLLASWFEDNSAAAAQLSSAAVAQLGPLFDQRKIRLPFDP